MTCHECIHKYCCKYDRFFGVDEVENKCSYFKNKDDFAEMVRCSKCKYGEVDIFSKAKDGEDIACYCTLKKVVTNTDCYCPSGRKR